MGWFKKRHKHEWELISVNDENSTTFTDQSNKPVYHEIRFYKCHCDVRKAESNCSMGHRGIKLAILDWTEAGVLPKGSYHPSNKIGTLTVNDIHRQKLDSVLEYLKTLAEMKTALGVVLNRDFDLEARHPKLKEAADEYHRRLDKYRNFDTLKDSK